MRSVMWISLHGYTWFWWVDILQTSQNAYRRYSHNNWQPKQTPMWASYPVLVGFDLDSTSLIFVSHSGHNPPHETMLVQLIDAYKHARPNGLTMNLFCRLHVFISDVHVSTKYAHTMIAIGTFWMPQIIYLILIAWCYIYVGKNRK